MQFITMYIFAVTVTFLILRRLIVKESIIEWLIKKD